MTGQQRSPTTTHLCLVGLLCASGIMAQIPQDRPELCGQEKDPPLLPSGTTFSLSSGPVFTSAFTFMLKNSSMKTVDLELPETVEQVCPIRNDRLLVFGTVAAGDGPIVWILSS